jgi:hypothetical protein
VPDDEYFRKEGRNKEMRVCSEKMFDFFFLDLFYVESRFIDFCLGVPLYPLWYTILILNLPGLFLQL